MSRAAPWPRESQTAPQKRDQSHWESSSLGMLGMRSDGEEGQSTSGDRETICSASAFV